MQAGVATRRGQKGDADVHLDVASLMVANAVVVSCLAVVLLFYRFNHITYPGFDQWLLSTWLAGGVFISVVLRSALPLAAGVALTNVLLILAALLRVDGVSRFTRGAPLPRASYLVVPATLPALLYFTVVRDDMVVRAMIGAVVAAALAMMAALDLGRQAPAPDRRLRRMAAAVYVVYGAALLGRSMYWFHDRSDDLVSADGVHQAYFLAVIALETAMGLGFLLLNNQRLEQDMLSARVRLQDTIDDLGRAAGEIRSLSGIIPICMHCKEIRDDKGYWNQLESFLAAHSEAQFSHSICDRCLAERHGDSPRV